ncbi:MAG: hypothetical protein R3E32_26145 [Chitinophagales bacterium]
MSKEKEKWKDAVLNSLEGIKRAEPNAVLFEKITQRIERNGSPSQIVPMNRVKMAAAAAILLLALNVFSITNYFKTNKSIQTENTIYQDVPSLISNYNLYD